MAETSNGPSSRGTPTSPSPLPPPPSAEPMSAEELFAADAGVTNVSAPLSDAAGPSRSPTPIPTPAPTKKGAKGKKPPRPVQLIGDLPVALEEACKTFEVLKQSRYQSKKLGLSQELLEGSQCDCNFDEGAWPEKMGQLWSN